jgi:tRNA-uridine 2-sulfurtransferase
LNFTSPFCTCDSEDGKCNSKEQAEALGIEYQSVPKGEEFIEVVRNPKHGYGQGLNPCIDCKIFILRKAKELMQELGVNFVITGEVLGQRPMSQHRRALQIIEKESGLEGLIVRPLSAQHFEETIPEKEGWINREEMLAIHGRSRKEQLNLAENFNIDTYSCGGGGCLLTEKQYAIKLKDLFDHQEVVKYKDLLVLKNGRHFRVNEQTKIIVGRNQRENEMLFYSKKADEFYFEVPDTGSPVTVLQGMNNQENIETAAQLTAYYSDANDETVLVKYGKKGHEHEIKVENNLTKEVVDKMNLTLKKLGNQKKIVDVIK